jgi:hypothetical protein
MAISSGSEAERMVWQAERMDERGRLARDWHQLLALYGFMAPFGSLWLFIAPFWLFMGHICYDYSVVSTETILAVR